jgi:hypothetical protein
MGQQYGIDVGFFDAARVQVRKQLAQRRTHRVAGAGVDNGGAATRLDQVAVDVNAWGRGTEAVFQDTVCIVWLDVLYDGKRRINIAVGDGSHHHVANFATIDARDLGRIDVWHGCLPLKLRLGDNSACDALFGRVQTAPVKR